MELTDAINVLKSHHLNVNDCDCMLYYCDCDHMGFTNAIAILEALDNTSDKS